MWHLTHTNGCCQWYLEWWSSNILSSSTYSRTSIITPFLIVLYIYRCTVVINCGDVAHCASPQSSICWTQVDPEWMQQEGNVLYLQPHQRGHKCHLQYLMPHKCGDWWGLFAKLQYEVSVPHYTTTPTSPQPTCDTPVTLPPTSKSNYKMIWVRT